MTVNRIVPVAVFALALVLLPGAASAQEPQQPPQPPVETELVFEREVFRYPAFQRRNPFAPLDAGAAGPRFEQLSVIGIMYSDTPTASVAVLSTGGVSVAADGTVSPVAGEAFYLRVGQRIGNVTIVEIRPDQVLVDVEEFGLVDRRTLAFHSRR